MGYRGKVDAAEPSPRAACPGLDAHRDLRRARRAASPAPASGAATSRSTRRCWPNAAAQRILAGNEGARGAGPNKLQRRKAGGDRARCRRRAERASAQLSDRELLVAGLGALRRRGQQDATETVEFANSDPRMIAVLRGVAASVLRHRRGAAAASLYLHEGLDLEAANAFWSDADRHPDRPSSASRTGRSRIRRIRRSKHPMGCPTVGYSIAATHREVMGMVDALLSSDGSDAASPWCHLQQRSIRGSSAGRASDC